MILHTKKALCNITIDCYDANKKINFLLVIEHV